MAEVSALRQRLSKYKRVYLQSRVIAAQRRRINFAFIHVPKCGGTSITQAIGQRIKLHDTAVERRHKLGHDRWNSIYSFSIVRHPYDRALSYYFFTKNTAYAESRLANLELNDWVRAALRDKTLGNHTPYRQLAPCYSWLTDKEGSVIVDDVFQLETLEQTWPQIKLRVGATGQLPHANRSGRKTKHTVFDKTSLRILRDHFQSDFEHFGYDT